MTNVFWLVCSILGFVLLFNGPDAVHYHPAHCGPREALFRCTQTFHEEVHEMMFHFTQKFLNPTFCCRINMVKIVCIITFLY